LLACSRFHQGAFADALRHAERGTTLYCAGTHSPLSGSLGEHPGIDCFTWMALTLWFLGRPNRALAKAEHAVSLADNPAYAYSRATAWAQRAVLHQLRREVKATRLWAQRTMNLAAEQGFPYREAVGKVLNGWALAQSGQPDLGVAELKAGIAGCRAAGAELDRPYHMALLAEVHIRARKYREATATLREALEQVGNAGCFYYEAELWRLHGHLNWLSATDRVAASEGFYRSLDIAQRQHAKSLELRAATSLARMLRDAGECRRGVEVVLPVYRSFAGVRETPDLRDARLEIEALEEDAARKIAV
jgi:predicted ATPase